MKLDEAYAYLAQFFDRLDHESTGPDTSTARAALDVVMSWAGLGEQEFGQ